MCPQPARPYSSFPVSDVFCISITPIGSFTTIHARAITESDRQLIASTPTAIEFRQRPQFTAGLRNQGDPLCKNHPEQKEPKQ